MDGFHLFDQDGRDEPVLGDECAEEILDDRARNTSSFFDRLMLFEGVTPGKLEDILNLAELRVRDRDAARAHYDSLVSYWCTDTGKVRLHCSLDGGDLREEEWVTLQKVWNSSCAYCGKYSKRPNIEHVRPRREGGISTLENIVPACARCNKKKYIYTLDDFLGMVAADEFRKKHAEKIYEVRQILKCEDSVN